jgi:hypothetical protein
MFDRTRTSVEMRTPAILSVALHVSAVVAAIVNFNFFSHAPVDPEPVMVDFVKIDKKAAGPTVGLAEPPIKNVKIADQTSKAPPPPTKEPPPAPETPKPEVKEVVPTPPKPEEKPKAEEPKPAEDKIALKPKEPEPPKVEKPPDPKPTPPKPEVKKVEPPKAAPPKPQPKKKDTVDNIVDSILKNEAKTPPIKTPETAKTPPKEYTSRQQTAPDLASVVTASEIDGVRQKIRPCWNFIGGAKDSDQLVVQLVVEMNQNGTPVSAEIKDRGRYNSDPLFRAAADSAYRAVLNPHCQPWPLSPDKYNSWRSITFNFDPRDY